jgi:hypothetical protein
LEKERVGTKWKGKKMQDWIVLPWRQWRWKNDHYDLTKNCKSHLAYNKVLHFAPNMRKWKRGGKKHKKWMEKERVD